jgi:hypothetical protein
MNHNVTLAIVAVVAAMTLTAVAFAIPQQALAYKHHNNHKNSIKVDQQVNQQNSCTGASSADTGTDDSSTNNLFDEEAPPSATVCLNSGTNTADIHR